jgi:hypothetical protein
VIDEARKKQMAAPGLQEPAKKALATRSLPARFAARVWIATAEMAGLNVLTYLTAYLDACGRNGGRAPSGQDLERFLPWLAAPENLRTWAQPPPPDNRAETATETACPEYGHAARWQARSWTFRILTLNDGAAPVSPRMPAMPTSRIPEMTICCAQLPWDAGEPRPRGLARSSISWW